MQFRGFGRLEHIRADTGLLWAALRSGLFYWSDGLRLTNRKDFPAASRSPLAEVHASALMMQF
jgi:hypothetical protein